METADLGDGRAQTYVGYPAPSRHGAGEGYEIMTP